MTVERQTKSTIRLATPDIDDGDIAAVTAVLRSGNLVQGAEAAAFESELCDFLGADYVVLVSSGTAALHLAMLALGIGQGDVVFVPSFAWLSAANSALAVGALPVFVDVEAETCNIDCGQLRRRIQECEQSGFGRLRAVVPVHEFGLPCDIAEVRRIADESEMVVIEDAACSLGARIGNAVTSTFGDLGIISFHPRKSITTGEGGLIVTSDQMMAERLKRLRNHGRSGGFDFPEYGLNYRMTDFQAALGRTQLRKYDRLLARRREIAERYNEQLADVPGLTLPVARPDHTWQTYMVVLDDGVDRDAVMRALADEGIQAGIGAIAAHEAGAFAGLPGRAQMPVSSRLFHQGLALPLHAGLSEADVSCVADGLRRAMAACTAAAG